MSRVAEKPRSRSAADSFEFTTLDSRVILNRMLRFPSYIACPRSACPDSPTTKEITDGGKGE